MESSKRCVFFAGYQPWATSEYLQTGDKSKAKNAAFGRNSQEKGQKSCRPSLPILSELWELNQRLLHPARPQQTLFSYNI